jgi:rare lipoprotein A
MTPARARADFRLSGGVPWLPRRALAMTLAAALTLSGGCATAPKPQPSIPAGTAAPASVSPPAALPNPASVPDAVPRIEPRSRYGNPPFYDVFGKRYYVLSSSADYVERGIASWYGPGFHKINTSMQEPYDMYAMTAAHKTLPLPAYVRVTNLQNGRSVVVRVNDRGPFVGNRIIDLSYTAAAKLDMLKNGTAMVEVSTIDPAAVPAPTPAAAPAAPRPALFVQAGAFANPANADKLVAKLKGGGFGKIFVREDLIAGRHMYRVRIGPVPDVPEFDRIVAALEQAGVHDAHLAAE